jgi:hypothetical protein
VLPAAALNIAARLLSIFQRIYLKETRLLLLLSQRKRKANRHLKEEERGKKKKKEEEEKRAHTTARGDGAKVRELQTKYRSRSLRRTLAQQLRMPFGEVMYRCNAHYCFSSVFRNRVVGLVITLALMQLFLFSFYLNGLHSQVVVTANTGTGTGTGGGGSSNSPVSSLEQQDERHQQQQPLAQQQLHPHQQPPHPHGDISLMDSGAAAAAAVLSDIDLGQRSRSVGQEVERAGEEFLNPAIIKAKAAMGDAAKKALDHLMTNKKPAMDLMAMAAKKLSNDPNDPMAKLGLNLLANAFNNIKNSQRAVQPKSTQQDPKEGNKGLVLDANVKESTSSPIANDVDDQSKSQYANLAQMGLQMLTNGLADPSSLLTSKGVASSSPDMRMLEMASQMMLSSKLSKAGFDPQMAKTALGLLKGAVASQKLDPRVILGLATKMMSIQQQLQQPSSSASGDTNNAGGLNLLSQVLSNGQLMSALLNSAGAAAAAAQPAVSVDQSNTIYRNYVKLTSRKLPALKSKMSSPYSIPSSKVVVDIGFHFTMEDVDTCRSNATYLIMAVSSAANTEERQAARETWIRDLHQLVGGKVDVVFVVGQTANVTLQRAVEEEGRTHRDLIQTNVQEPIEKSVFKTLAGLVWIDRHCPEIEQILKIDDDVYVSAATMLKAMEKGKARPTITGSLIDSMNPFTTTGELYT